ncbi:hypothetical protein PVAP13_6KG208606 [Panicum virgatum]|uniref:Protein FAR1-RELATED SEQUENCE n=1 Tax=Panicum virgatum TaxID=38727 RepID=A0A8T0RFU6_PANVG|nr:hypothetical protein PVAP13_6KG208606 [Panicum virgatum]
MIRLLRTSDHAWYISRICDVHNHKLSEGFPGKNKQWNSHNTIDATPKHFVQKLRENNVSIGRACSILKVSNANPAQHIRKETIRALRAKLSRENLQDDIGKTLKLLDEMKRSDPHMLVRFKLDGEGTIRSMFWCTGKNKVDYEHFGDAITFDTTYKTNLCSLPFGFFVGINNHFQSIIFGGVMLTSETTEEC